MLLLAYASKFKKQSRYTKRIHVDKRFSTHKILTDCYSPTIWRMRTVYVPKLPNPPVKHTHTFGKGQIYLGMLTWDIINDKSLQAKIFMSCGVANFTFAECVFPVFMDARGLNAARVISLMTLSSHRTLHNQWRDHKTDFRMKNVLMAS